MIINRRSVVKNALAFPLLAYLDSEHIWSPTPLRVCLIGHTGRGDYGHGLDTAWLTIPNVKLVAVADSVHTGLESAKKRLGISRGYASYTEMLKEERPDITCIAPRFVNEHYDMVVKSIENGTRAIYMEKPFCRNLNEANSIVTLCKKHHVKLAIAHRNRYHPAIKTVEKLINDGQIGELIEISGRGKEDHRGGALDLWVLGSHILNLVPIFTGKFTACYASMYQDNAPIRKSDLREGAEGVGTIAGNALHARFETARGIPFFFDSIQDRKNKNSEFGFRIYGTKGVFEFRIDQEPFIYYASGSDTEGTSRTWLPVSSQGINVSEKNQQLHSELMNHHIPILDLIKTLDSVSEPLCNAQDGLDIVESIMAIYASQLLDGARITFPLQRSENPLDTLK